MKDREAFITWFQGTYPGLDPVLGRLLTYGDELLRVTESLALVSRGDRTVFWTRHVQESIPPALVEALRGLPALLDIGSGNGLPGFALALLLPEMSVSLLEPRRKKAGFLDRMRLLAGAPNVNVIPKTLEELGRESNRAFPQAVVRGLRFTPRRLEALEAVSTPEAVLFRYGPDRGMAGDLPVGDRVIQRIPRADWTGALLP